MRLSVLAFVLMVAPAAAHAEGLYLSLGSGGDAVLSDGLGDYYGREVGGVGRMMVGRRYGPWAIEGVVLGTGLTSDGGYQANTLSLGADLKFHVPLLLGIELYVRGGGHYTWLSTEAGPTASHGGDVIGGAGVDYGTGLQFRITAIPGIQAGVWADVGRQLMRLRRDDEPALEGALQMFTVGVTIGRM